MKSLGVCAVLVVIATMFILSTTETSANQGRGDVVVYVTSQNLFYDSVVNGPLPPKGKFQLLEMEGPTGLQTEFGPGDAGYLGGRWWVDVNGNGMMDAGDDYFSCPLVGPGCEVPL